MVDGAEMEPGYQCVSCPSQKSQKVKAPIGRKLILGAMVTAPKTQSINQSQEPSI